MLTHRGFSAWIVSEGIPVPEYLVAVDAKAHRVSCWIPSEEGKTFSVYWRDHGGKVDSCSFITLDGYVVPGRFLFGTGVASRQGVRSGNCTEKPFVFTNAEDIGNENQDISTKENGIIALRIKRVSRIGGRPPNPVQNIPMRRGSRKVADLCVGFGQDTQAFYQYPCTWSVKMIDKPSTFVTFIFRYRSRAFLVGQGIMSEAEAENYTPDGTECPVRRVASAPTTPLKSGGPIAPSPSHSPVTRAAKPLPTSSAGSKAKDVLLGKKPIRSPVQARQRFPIQRSVTMTNLTAPSEVNPGQALLWFETGLALAKSKDSPLEEAPIHELDDCTVVGIDAMKGVDEGDGEMA